MTRCCGVFPVMCPDEVAGAGLAPACWPDQKPVHPVWGVTRHSRAARGSHPQTGYRSVPQPGLEVDRDGCRSAGLCGRCRPASRQHAVGVVDVRSGVVVFETAVAADSGGYADALRVAEQHAPGRRAFAVEGTGSYGAGLTRFLSRNGERVFEVGRLPRERRSGGKTDALDAVRAARSVLAQERPATPSGCIGAMSSWPTRRGRYCGSTRRGCGMAPTRRSRGRGIARLRSALGSPGSCSITALARRSRATTTACSRTRARGGRSTRAATGRSCGWLWIVSGSRSGSGRPTISGIVDHERGGGRHVSGGADGAGRALVDVDDAPLHRPRGRELP